MDGACVGCVRLIAVFVFVQRVVNIGRTLNPCGNPKGFCLFDFAGVRVGVSPGCDVAVYLRNYDIARAAFGFRRGHVAETYAHGFGSSVLAGECGEILVKLFTVLRLTPFCENSDFHYDTILS